MFEGVYLGGVDCANVNLVRIKLENLVFELPFIGERLVPEVHIILERERELAVAQVVLVLCQKENLSVRSRVLPLPKMELAGLPKAEVDKLTICVAHPAHKLLEGKQSLVVLSQHGLKITFSGRTQRLLGGPVTQESKESVVKIPKGQVVNSQKRFKVRG